ncbi:extracellular solute-binding protein [Paenibacillus sp. 1P07SE]|uniref:extracellular solute-binding protein n=1 Tax=Paenibacillus sp. 1P07SE TaxID=3132209 RepID=UPI0039A5178E
MKNRGSMSLYLMLAAALFMTACTANSPSTDTSAHDPGERLEESPSNAPVIEFPLAEKLTLRFFALKAVANKVTDYNQYELFQQLEEETNVHIEWSIADETARLERLNLMVASGDYPDAVYGSSITGSMLSTWAKQGIAIPLNDLITAYAPNIQKAFAENPAYKEAITHADGNIYSLPTIQDRPFQQAPDTMWINKNWLDQVGLDVPETTEELYAALQAFKGKDLNGNGKDDEIPMSFMYRTHWKGGNSLAMSFGIMDPAYDHTYINDGQIYFAPQQDQYRDYVDYIGKLYAEDLIDQEMFTQTNPIYEAKLRGETAVLGVLSYPINSYVTDGDQYVPLLGLKGPNGDWGWTKQTPGINVGGFVITSSNRHPEITMKWIDSHFDFEKSLELLKGPLGQGLIRLDNGKYEAVAPPQGMSENDFAWTMAPGFQSPKIIPASNYADGTFISPREAEELAAYQLKEPLLKFEPLNNILVYEEEDYEALEHVDTDLNNPNGYIDTIFAEFVMNGTTDEKWAKHLDQLEKLGIRTYLEVHGKYQVK